MTNNHHSLPTASRSRRHPSKDIEGSDGNELSGKRIVLCITASVAGYCAIDLARLLIRHGADVHAVMSKTAEQMVTPEMMKWATGNSVVTQLTGDLEHIALADYGASDLIIVYPCTANTIGKAAHGIDDTPVTSVLSVAIGSGIPIIIAPAMHEAMYRNSAITKNIEYLRSLGVQFVGPTMAEGKAKAAEPDQVFQASIEILRLSSLSLPSSSSPLSGKRILVTAGSTIEFIDPVRVITNLSSGKMGNAIASEAHRLGAYVTLVYGHGSEKPSAELQNVIHVNTAHEMLYTIRSELKSKSYDIVIMAAAVADYAPENKSDTKIDTRATEGSVGGGKTIKLVPTKKIVDEVKKLSKQTFLVAFKADHNISKSKLIDKALVKLKECDADLVVANDLANHPPGSDLTEVYVVDGKRNVTEIQRDTKNVVARKLMELILSSSSSLNKRPELAR